MPTAEVKTPKYDHFVKPSKILEETEIHEYNQTFENEEIPEPYAVPAEECFAQNEAVIEYVNAASHGATSFPATDLLKYVFKTLLCWNLCVFPVEIAATGANNNLLWLFLVIFLDLAILAFFWMRRRCLQLENDLREVRAQLHHTHAALVTANLQADTATTALAALTSRADTATTDMEALNRRAKVLTVMYDEVRGAFGRRTLGYHRAQRAFVEMRNTAIERQRALQIAAQDLGAGYEAIAALQTHFRTRPQGGESFNQIASDVWHLDDDCDEIHDSGHEVRVLRPCAICNRQNLQEVDVDADPVRHFDGQGIRVVDAPPGMEF